MPPIFIRTTLPEEQSGWQPIESAPKDGTPFLAAIGPHVEMVHRSVQSWVITNHGMAVEPSHWMPLPSAPAALSEKGA